MPTFLENTKLSIQTLIAAIVTTWVLGTGMAVWAANQENRLSTVERAQKKEEESRKEVEQSVKDLTQSVNSLDKTLQLLNQRLELEAAEARRREAERRSGG